MKNMKLRTRIISGFIIVAVIGLWIGAAGLISIQLLNKLSSEQNDLRAALVDATGVLSAHYEWRQSLSISAFTGAEFTGSVDPDNCALGKWLKSDTSKSDDPEINRLFQEIDIPHRYIHEEAKNINSMIVRGDLERAATDYQSNLLPKTNETIDLIGQLEQRYSELLDGKTARMLQLQAIMSIAILALLVGALAASILLARYITGTIMKPIRDMNNCADRLSIGHLEFACDYTVDDEIGSLARSIRNLISTMTEQARVLQVLASGDYRMHVEMRSDEDVVHEAINALTDQSNRTLLGVRESSIQVAAGSREIAQVAQSLAAGSTEQAASIDEFSKTLSHFREDTAASSSLATETLTDIQKTSALMNESLETMEQMLHAMENIDKSSTEIQVVTKLIDDIAFQTNILALNAAVEAARAGEHGKGFAIVADEVRNLAVKSADAARETTELVLKSIESVNEGNEFVERVGNHLKSVGELADRNAEAISKINEASLRQNNSVEDLNNGIGQIAIVTQANSATAEEMAASAEEMSAQAALLNGLIEEFKLNEGEPESPVKLLEMHY